MADRNAQTRRRWLGTCTGVAGTAVLAGCFGSEDDGGETSGNGGNGDGASEGSLGEDWPMYGVDLQNTAHQPDATGPEGNELTAREIVDIGGSSSKPASIVDGTVYVPSTSGMTYAVEPDQGEARWEKEGYQTPTIYDGTVYGPTDGGQVYGYDIETGDRWVSEEIPDVDGGLGAPIIVGEKILASSNEAIWQIDSDTGEYTNIVDTPSYVGSSTDQPAYHDGMYYIGRFSVLYGINVDSSEIEWTFEPDEEGNLSGSNPAVSNGMVYLTSRDRKLHAIDTDSGDEAWTVDTGTIETSPAVANGLVYTAERDQVIAVDADEGDIEWREEDAIIGEPEDIVIADGVCYVTTRNGISAYDAASGDLKWEYEIPDDSSAWFDTSPAISDGTIYLPSRDETLYAIEDA